MTTDIDAMRALYNRARKASHIGRDCDALDYAIDAQLPTILDELEAARAEIARLRILLEDAKPIIADMAAGGSKVTRPDDALIVFRAIKEMLKPAIIP